MHTARIVLCGDTFGDLRDDLVKLGLDARLDDARRGPRDVLLLDRRGAAPSQSPARTHETPCLAWVNPTDVGPGFDPGAFGADDFIAGPLSGTLVAARCAVLLTARDADERLALLARTLSDAMWDLDVVTRTIVWSDGITAQFGYSLPLASDYAWWLANVHPMDRYRVEQKITGVFSSGDSWSDEYRFRHADGQYRPTLDRGVVVRDGDGRAIRMVGAMTNIGERRLMEARLAQAERISTMGTLAAGLAHEINNPLAIATGHVEQATTALEHGDLVATRAHLASVQKACGRVSAIVADLRVANRRPDANSDAVDVGNAITSALALTRNEIRHRAKLVRTIERVPPVCGSEARLVQVLVNLLLNAAQAIPEGDAARNEIHLGVREVGSDIVIEVGDTGIGMEPEDAANAFEPFFARRESRTGIGLTICRDIIRGMSGEIALDSTPRQGTVVRLRLPKAPANRTPPSLPPTVDTQATALTVMLIDDEPDLRMVMVSGLAQHRVVSCASATEALEILANGARFDAILCDVMMPDVTGMDFYEQVSALDANQAARMGFVTGGAFTPRAQAFVDARPARILEKPFRLRDLAALVQRLSQRHST